MSNRFTECYNSENAKIIDEIKMTHNWEVDEGFIADGLISPEHYDQQKIKIAVMLGESYGYYKGCVDIQKQPDQDYLGVGHPKRMTAKKIPMLLWLIFNHIERGEWVSKDEFNAKSLLKTSANNTNELQGVLRNIAWINVKKASKVRNSTDDSSRQDDAEIAIHTKRNALILQKQLEIIKPKIIIACSDPVFNSMHDCGLLGNGITKGKKYIMQHNDNAVSVIHLSHPSYYKVWTYEGIYKIYETIMKSVA